MTTEKAARKSLQSVVKVNIKLTLTMPDRELASLTAAHEKLKTGIEALAGSVGLDISDVELTARPMRVRP
jgi:hypothetical protein